eukprot:490911_1
MTETRREQDALLIESSQQPIKKQSKCTKYIWIRVVAVILIAAIIVIVVLATQDSSEQSSTWNPPKPCDPLVQTKCYLPWPNDYFLSKSNNYKPSKLSLSDTTLPLSNSDETIDPASWNMMDGFSPLPAIMTYFENISLDNSNVARLWDVEVSLNENAPIILLETDTLTPIPYWVELDYSSDINGGNGTIINNNPDYPRMLMIWPAYRLQNGKRYIVAMRNLRDNDNNLIPATEGFVYFRDNIQSTDSAIEDRRSYFNRYIFDVLRDVDIVIQDLQLAWDFTVQSHDMMTKLMRSMRDDAFNRVLINDVYDVKYRITSIIDDPDYGNPSENPNVTARQITGEMEIPWYLTQREAGVTVRVVTDNNDYQTPVFQSMEWVTFRVIIPQSVWNGSITGKWLEYGHGLFGTYAQVDSSAWRREMFNKYGYIGVAVSLLGMSSEDSQFAFEVLTTDITDFEMIPDRLHQGMLSYLILNKLCSSPNFYNNVTLFQNEIVNENTNQYYYGISQGGIMGAVLLALSEDINRAVLDVPGFPYELLLPRSVDFSPFWNVTKGRYSNEMDRIFLISFQQILWNRLTPSGYIAMIKESDTSKNALIHYSLGDSEVTWLGAYQMARTLGCYMYDSQIAEGNETIYGIEFIDDDTIINIEEDIDIYGSNICKIQGWDYAQYPDPPFVNIPPLADDNTHGLTSPQETAQDALNTFLTQSDIINTCQGPCQF